MLFFFFFPLCFAFSVLQNTHLRLDPPCGDIFMREPPLTHPVMYIILSWLGHSSTMGFTLWDREKTNGPQTFQVVVQFFILKYRHSCKATLPWNPCFVNAAVLLRHHCPVSTDPSSSWLQFGRDCNVLENMHPSSSSWPPTRSWWWSVPRNGKICLVVEFVVLWPNLSQLTAGLPVCSPCAEAGRSADYSNK